MHGKFMRRGSKRVTALGLSVGLACSLTVAGSAPASAAPAPVAPPGVLIPAPDLPGGLMAVDPQEIDDLYEMTWDDFNPIPNSDWANPAVQPTIRKFRAAVVMVDYPDQPFLVTLPAGSTKWGTPGPAGQNVPRAEVGNFYRDMLNTPQAANNFHTINEYWMEDTGGAYGVEMIPFGPYQMPKKSYQYFYSAYSNSGGVQTDCPAAMACNGNIRTDANVAWLADTGFTRLNFDIVFYLGAGMGQSSTWSEFGRMMFETPDTVSDLFGPPQEWKDAITALGETPVNWAPSRYTWSSWASAASMWANASQNTSIESEADGTATFAHEFSHNLSIGDNYGDPFSPTAVREPTGPFDMMSRGHFNGPGGTHKRWDVPSVLGDVMGSQHMLRDKMFLNILPANSVVNISRTTLAANGPVVTEVIAREAPLPGQKVGVNIQLDGTTATGGGDRSTCASMGKVGDLKWLCDANSLSANSVRGNYNNYTMEVVDQMGTDSFQSDSGVLIAKSKNSGSPGKWVIDANPQDIDQIDAYLADGTPLKYSRGDHRQLTDALFKAGSDSGSEFEYVDVDNSLHLYVLDLSRNEDGILSYKLAARNTDGAGTQARGVTLGAASVSGYTPGQVVSCTVPLTNTGAAGVEAMYSSDIYRLSASATGTGWTTWLPQQIVTAAAGESTTATVYGLRAPGATDASTLSLTATSESDATKTATSTCDVTTADTATAGTGVQVITADTTGGALTLSTPTTTPITMNPVQLTGLDQITSGTLNNVNVADARGTSVGWNLTGQATDFIAGTGTILAANLGWRPTALAITGTLPTTTPSTITPGPVATPGTGLDTAKTLCTSPEGTSAGAFTCGGGLDLGIPGSASLGTYTGLLTLTLI